MQKSIGAALCCGLLAMTGCSTAPVPPVPAPVTAPQWYAPLPHSGKLSGLAQWWRQLDDPLLVQLIEAGQAVSPTVAQAASRMAQAKLARTTAQAAMGPRLDGSLSANRNRSDPSVPAATILQGALQTQWEIDLFGGLAASRDAAQARLEGAQAGWHEARVSVAAEIAGQYYSRRACERLLVIAQSDATSRGETARLADLSTQAGFTAPASAALARASAAEGSMRLLRQQGLCDLDIKALVALSGLPEPQLREQLAQGAGTLPLPRPFAVPQVPALLLTQRPDVFNAQQEVAAASAEVGHANVQRYPRLTLSGNVAAGRYYTGGRSAEIATWSIGPLALSLPILDGGVIGANIDAAAAHYEEAAALYQARVRQAVREVEEAMVNLNNAQARDEDARVATQGYRASFTATEARYRSGLASLVELEDTRRTALAAESSLVDLQRERVNAWIALYRAVGGGWTQERSAQAPSAAPPEGGATSSPAKPVLR